LSNKSQISIIDLLFLILIFSLLILFVSYSYENEFSSKVIDLYENRYNQYVLISTLGYKINNNEFSNKKILELVGIFLCTNDSYLNKTLDDEIRRILTLLNKENYNYILYSKSKNALIWVYNKQASVCLKDIHIASFDLDLPCNDKTQVLLGTWPNSLNVREEC